MARSYLRQLLLALAAVCASCTVLSPEDPKLEDGSLCADNKDCRSGFCTTSNLCAHSSCNCPGSSCPENGARSSDCGSAWLCVASTNVVEHVGMFFSGDTDNDGYCELPCSAGCPTHYSCGGQFCVADEGWADPVPSVSWSGAAEGMASGKGASMNVKLEPEQTVSLKASATSPADAAIESFSWTLVDGSGQQLMTSGDAVDLTIAKGDNFRRAELSVTDAKKRSSIMYVIFEACLGAGTQCGYQGSGCCASCDSASNLCN